MGERRRQEEQSVYPEVEYRGKPDMRRFRSIFEGEIPPYLQRLTKRIGKTINTFEMLPAGSKAMIAVSGGKDSLALALALSLRRTWMPVRYDLEAVMVEWREHSLTREQAAAVDAYFEAIEVPFTRIPAGMFPDSFKGRFNCFLCARNRKRVLFDEMRRRGTSIIAVGHHLDDIVETTLMNLSMRGSFSTMMPVQEFFEGRVKMIRPMAEIPEEKIRSLHRELELPVVTIPCPYRERNIRGDLKPLIRELTRLNSRARQNIFRAGFNIDHDYVPGLAAERD
ncbi:MAG: ATP-binding protein [Spirochaetaceae bacterium]